MSSLKAYLERESERERKVVPVGEPVSRTILSPDKHEKLILGIYRNGVVLLHLFERLDNGGFQLKRVWHRRFPPENAVDFASGKARAFLEERCRSRMKEKALRDAKIGRRRKR